MRRMWLIALIGVALFVGGIISSSSAVFPANAQDPVTPEVGPTFGPLLSLAAYLPRGTQVYFSIRSDQMTIDTLNGLFTQVQRSLPIEILNQLGTNETIPLQTVLDRLAESNLGRDYQNGVRPWLSDTIGFAIVNFDSTLNNPYNRWETSPMLLMAEITDREAAAGFALELLGNAFPFYTWERTETEIYTWLTPVGGSEDLAILIMNQAMFFGSYATLRSLMVPIEQNLTTDPYFNTAIGRLTAGEYGALAYVDAPTILSYALGSNPRIAGTDRVLLMALLKSIGTIAFGGAVIESSLVFDTVITVGNLRPLEALGLSTSGTVQLDPNFMRFVPSDAALIVHGTQLPGIVGLAEANLSGIFNLILLQDDDAQVGRDLAAISRQTATQIADIFATNLTGLDLPTQLDNWFSGDFAVYLRGNSVYVPEIVPNPVEGAAVFRVRDGAISQSAIAQLIRDLPLTLRSLGLRGARFSEETHFGAPVLVIAYDEPNFYNDETWQADWVFAVSANQQVLTFGMYGAVIDTLAVSQSAEGSATHRVLPVLESRSVALYWNSIGVAPLFSTILLPRINDNVQARPLVERAILALGDGTISLAFNEQGDTLVRFSFTIPTPLEVNNATYLIATEAAQVAPTLEQAFQQAQLTLTAQMSDYDATATQSQMNFAMTATAQAFLPTLIPSPTPTR